MLSMATRIVIEDLEAALDWVSGSPAFDSAAYVALATGRIYWQGADLPDEEDLPDNLDDESMYLPVPHRNVFGLGRALALEFVDEVVPGLRHEVGEAFRRKGGFRRFKDVLQRAGMLERWYEYERAAVRAALLEWALDNGFSIAASADA